MHIKLLSLNCFGIPISFNKKLRFTNIAKSVADINPDIIFFQEVWMNSDRKTLNKILSKNGYSIYPKTYARYGPGGLIIFVKSLKINDLCFFRFKDSGPLTALTIHEKIAGKGFQGLKIKIDNTEITVIHTHLLCAYGRGDKMLTAMKNELAQISSYIGKNKSPLLIVGDINLFPDDDIFLEFKKTLSLHDCLKKDQYTVELTNLNRGKMMNLYSTGPFRTDYILTNNLLKAEEVKIVFKNTLISNGKKFQLSDHYAILANILW